MKCEEFRRRWRERDVEAGLTGNPDFRSPEPETSHQGRTADSATPRAAPNAERSVASPGAAWTGASHLDDCADCTAWVARWRALDDALASALLVAPPPDLAVQLARIPAPFARPATESVGQRVLAMALLAVVALGTIGLSGVVLTFVAGLVWPFAADALQAIPLLLDSPLIGYYQSLASTLLEAMATLVLAALMIAQMRPTASAEGRRG